MSDLQTFVGALFGLLMIASFLGTAVANFRSNRNKEAILQQQATIAALETQLDVMKDSNADLRAQLVDARADSAELRGQLKVMHRDFAEVIAKAVIDLIPQLWGHQ